MDGPTPRHLGSGLLEYLLDVIVFINPVDSGSFPPGRSGEVEEEDIGCGDSTVSLKCPGVSPTKTKESAFPGVEHLVKE